MSPRRLQALGGAQVVLATASGGKAVAAALGGLRRGGVVISLGATDEPIELSAFDLLFKSLASMVLSPEPRRPAMRRSDSAR